MKYKVGDKVKVREDLRLDRTYNKFTINRKMKNLAGTIVTIQRINENYYRIVEDDGMWGWTDKMFEDKVEENKMDNNNITVNMENLSQEERSTLLSLIGKANKPKNKVWKPEKDETYYYSYSDGNIEEATWDNLNVDENRYAIGNCFKTKEEAEFALERQKVITELKRFALEHNEKEIDWSNDDEQKKYCLYFNHERNRIMINNFYVSQFLSEQIYFTSDTIAQQAIKEIGEERLEKYYFEVKE